MNKKENKRYVTKVVGVTFDNRQEHIRSINPLTDTLLAEREPTNPYDKNAIHIKILKPNQEEISCGYIDRNLAKEIAPELDAGNVLLIENFLILGNLNKKEDSIVGVQIEFII